VGEEEIMSETQKNGQNINVGKKERAASLAAGGALVLYGLSKRSWFGGLVALAGGALVHVARPDIAMFAMRWAKKARPKMSVAKANSQKTFPDTAASW
jgi:uncharacterized membrane protein